MYVSPCIPIPIQQQSSLCTVVEHFQSIRTGIVKVGLSENTKVVNAQRTLQQSRAQRKIFLRSPNSARTCTSAHVFPFQSNNSHLYAQSSNIFNRSGLESSK